MVLFLIILIVIGLVTPVIVAKLNRHLIKPTDTNPLENDDIRRCTTAIKSLHTEFELEVEVLNQVKVELIEGGYTKSLVELEEKYHDLAAKAKYRYLEAKQEKEPDFSQEWVDLCKDQVYYYLGLARETTRKVEISETIMTDLSDVMRKVKLSFNGGNAKLSGLMESIKSSPEISPELVKSILDCIQRLRLNTVDVVREVNERIRLQRNLLMETTYKKFDQSELESDFENCPSTL